MTKGDLSPKGVTLERISRVERQNNKLQPISGVKMTIRLMENKTVSKRPYPIPLKLQEALNEEIQRLLSEWIIRKAQCTDYISPAYPIVKKNGKIKLDADY
ncbi:hypothetical protein RF11_12147 [Thelohanellus kitauei]|uniref:Uncharacterized protein n=1 Tax=Thelohanellus kitauei TaxID=669202 RepID=A0A0C2J1E0_THEKT|nr:hypothetical protein RF11_12147 [Thelohanellus kitauei]